MWDGTAFSGTKIALICETSLVAYLRDDKEGIPFPGLWDLPGGGREASEDPTACVLREVEEEFGLRLPPDRVRALTRYESQTPGGLDTYFCLADVGPDDIEQIRFGDEGQRWSLMPIDRFISHERAVPHLQHRLKAILTES
jgi:8-oxo-dGTP diphosphatase